MTIIRNYDIAIPDEFRKAVQARRTDPDGEPRLVRYVARGRQTVKKYPWDEMLVGDFFVCRLDGTRYEVAVNMMYQAARIRDVEVACRRWEVDGEPGIRVVLVMQDLRAVKIAARDHHKVDLRIHSRSAYLKRRADERAASYRRARAASAPPVTPVPAPETLGDTSPPPPAPIRRPKPRPAAPPTLTIPSETPILDPEAAVAKTDAETQNARARLMALRREAQNEGDG